MVVIETWLHQDLQEPVKVNHLDGNLFSNNGNGNRIGVVLTNNGEALASISGTVSGYVVTADGSTVPCTGSKSGNRASILIPAAAYQPGSIFITVFVTDGTTVTTIGSVSTTVMRSRTNAQVDPGSAVTDWTQTINAAMQSVETAAANLGGIVAVPYASITFPVPLGKYTYYNNNLYRCISPIASSESFTAAHWTQVRLGDDVSDLKSALVNSENSGLRFVQDIVMNNDKFPYINFEYPLKNNDVVYIRLNSISGGSFKNCFVTDRSGNTVLSRGIGTSTVGEIIKAVANQDISNIRVLFNQNSAQTGTLSVDFEIFNFNRLINDVISGKINTSASEVSATIPTIATEKANIALLPFNCFIGSDDKKITIDTTNKTIKMDKGLWFPKKGQYVYLSADKTITYTNFTVPSTNTIVDVYYNVTNAAIEIKLHSDLTLTDNYIVLFTIYVQNYSTWAFNRNNVYFANQFTKDVTHYVGDIEEQAFFNTNIHTARIFKKVVCCGDSYTEGYIVDSEGVVHPSEKAYSWVNYIAKSTGNNWLNAGDSGATTRSYQTHFNGLPYAKTLGKPQAYVIGLMINDITADSPNNVPLGVPTDIGTNNDTYYGNMSKIIRELHTVAPDAFIFVNTCPKSAEGGTFAQDYANYNEAVRTICQTYKDTYKTHCIDLAANSDLYKNQSLIDDYNHGHYSAVGYEQFAEIYEYILSNYINQDPLVFQDVPFIEYDE